MAAKKKTNDGLVPVKLFQDTDKYRDDVTVGLNGTIYKIQRGKVVMVPKEVKEILDHSEFQDNQTVDMIKEMESDYRTKSKNLEQ